MSFLPSFARKGACICAVAALAGCGSDDGSASYKAGCEAFAVRDLKRAAALFEKTVQIASTNAEAFVGLARVRLELGELSAARQAVDRAAAMTGSDADVLLLSAQIDWHAKRYDAAAKTFWTLAEDKDLPADVRSQAWAGLGVVEWSRDNYHLARVAFLRAIRLDRRQPAAWYHLGLLYRDGFGYLEAALEQLSIYVRLEAVASPRVQKVQRTVIPEIKDKLAREAANRPGAARRTSGASGALVQKADAAWKAGSFKSARKLYQQALDADALSFQAALGLAKATLKCDASKAGQQQALSCYRRACALNPGSVSAFLTAGNLALQLGQPSSAAEIYSRAVAANPTSREALDGLIRALRRAGNRARDAQVYQDYRASLDPRQ